jgi:glycosyltransferase involved in cell wall biosynthesis
VPVAVIPPGTDLPEIVEPRTSNSTRTALFLSRIAPNKGLLILLKAWAAIRPKDWRLVVAGSSEGGHQEECQRAVKQYKLEDSITFVGSAFQDKKWGQYFGADLFILPTLSENFGIAVAEALACGIPVITTKGAPWEELENYKCGWWIEIGVDPLIAAMKQAFALNIQELKEMGLRGRKLIEQKYTWPMIARKMLTVYKWAMGDGQRPECIKFG